MKRTLSIDAKFKRTFLHPLMVSHVLLLGVWMGILISLSTYRFEITVSAGVIAWMGGWVLWTLVEYVLNRWLLHLPGSSISIVDSIIQYHARHHDHPERIEYTFIHPALVAFTVIPLLLWSLVMSSGAGLIATSGFLFGYLGFIVLHACEHHYVSPPLSFMKGLWQHHFLHHHNDAHAAFGVSTLWWDVLFSSMPVRRSFIAVDPAAAITGLRVLEVNDEATGRMFLDIPASIYADDPCWISPVREEVTALFNPLVNPYFTHGTAKRWILVQPSGQVMGRIAAFIDFNRMYEEEDWVGGLGFFECAGGTSSAFLLFDTAVNWLKKHFKVTVVEGPINFGKNDKYWGLLVDGFTTPSYGMNYNPTVYQKYFEDYGFRIHYRQLTNYLDLRKPFPERFLRIAERTLANPRYSFRPFRYREKEGFVSDFLAIYNSAWASFDNFHPLTTEDVQKSLAEMKPVMEEDFIWFAYARNTPVGFILAVPDANDILRYSGDPRGPWGKLKFAYYRRVKGFTRARVVVMGIVPEYQNHGLESALIFRAFEAGKKKSNYRHVELSWVGDFNTKMIAIHKAMGAVQDKQHATYRKPV